MPPTTLTLDLSLNAIVEFLFFIITMVGVYYKVIRKGAVIEAAATAIDTNNAIMQRAISTNNEQVQTAIQRVARDMTEKIEAFQRDVQTTQQALLTSVTGLQTQVSDIDNKFVRKDVHDAHLSLINEKLKPLDQLSKTVNTMLLRSGRPLQSKAKVR